MNFRNVLAGMLVIALGAGTLMAQGTPSYKAYADVNTLVKCHMTTAQSLDDTTTLPADCTNLWTGDAVAVNNDGFIDIMDSPVKLSNSQSLFVSPSLVTGLYTETKTKTRVASTSTAQAMGGVYLRAVLVDSQGKEIEPAPLTMCDPDILGCVVNQTDGKSAILLDSRVQTLSQTLSACVIDVTSITGTNDGTCDFTSTIDLILKTTSAHTFNFIFPNVGQGVYTLKIQAAVASDASIIEGSGAAIGSAAFGVGSVVAQSVRLGHDFTF